MNADTLQYLLATRRPSGITVVKSQAPKRIIVHVDMDAFFAAIEQLDHPELRGKPVIIGADPRKGQGRGVVSTCSYEAREYGIHSAMPISRAYRLCPHGEFRPPRFQRYSELSRMIMSILSEFSPLVEPVSIDEAFLDCTGTEKLFGTPEQLGRRIRSAVQSRTQLTASVGIAGNKYVAKVASDLNKPDGLSICPPGEERLFLSGLPIRRLWGAGPRSVRMFEQSGIRTIGQLAALSADEAEERWGNRGHALWLLSHGKDSRPVISDWERKSISEERTFPADVADTNKLLRTLEFIADDLARRMRREKLLGRTITLKIRLEGFETYTRSTTLPHPVDDLFSLRDTAGSLFYDFPRRGKKVRLIGIGVSNLVRQNELTMPGGQLDLFTQPEPPGRSEEKLLDELRNRFGSHVTRARLMRTDGEEFHSHM